jgi:hypothetical protein
MRMARDQHYRHRERSRGPRSRRREDWRFDLRFLTAETPFLLRRRSNKETYSFIEQPMSTDSWMGQSSIRETAHQPSSVEVE